MIKLIFLLTLLTALFTTIDAQDSLPAKHAYYKASVFTDSKQVHKGYLSSISDSSLSISLRPTRLHNFENNDHNQIKIDLNKINKVTLRRKGAVGGGVLVGGLFGLGVGVISGLLAGDDPPCKLPVQNSNDVFGLGQAFGQFGYGVCETFRTTGAVKATFRGIGGALGGVLAGALIGSLVHKTFLIGRDKQKLQEMKSTLLP